MRHRSTPELLAPAGDRRALRAALAAGADAVYFGLERWSARAFAGNFAPENAVEAIELAHLYDARAHLALNTLLKDDEVETALAALEAAYAAGLDALIVADIGFAARVREEYPGLPLHASTQLNTHSSAQLAALARLGFDRAILARELGLTEIAALEAHGLELEAFVHGALCYGYSGDCLLSSMVGGRSGNRGRCSQSCRMRYRLSLVSPEHGASRAAGAGPARPSGAARDVAGTRDARDPSCLPGRVLSTADLCAIGALPALLAAGVTSFKIEGRMKDAAYVAVTTAVYREALDAAVADPEAYTVRPMWLERLEQAFSRGFTSAYLDGRPHGVRSGGRGGHRGVLVGRVERVGDGGADVVVRLNKPVAAGDVVSVYTAWGQSDPVRVEASADDRLTLRVRQRVAVKDRVFRVAGAEVGALARDILAGRVVARPVEVTARFEGRAGEAARLTLRVVPGGPEVTVRSDEPLTPARRVALDAARVREAVAALGGTPYRLSELGVDLDVGLFLPVGELKGLRRRAVAALNRERLAAWRRGARRASTDAPARHAPARDAFGLTTVPLAVPGRASGRGPEIQTVLVLRPGEEPVLGAGVTGVCLELEVADDPTAVRAVVDRLAGLGVPLRCRPPEVLFDADLAWWREVAAGPWSAVYVRHLGLLSQVPDSAAVILEYPLQGLNADAAAVVRGLAITFRDMGTAHVDAGAASRGDQGVAAGPAPAAVVASPEASLQEIARLAAGLARLDPPVAVEALAFGRQQVLRTRDQLGRADGLVDAPGLHGHTALLLHDASGYVFQAEVDRAGTRVFNARVTNLAAHLDELAAAGVASCLVRQTDMDDGERRAFLAGGLPALAPFATRERATTGHLFRGVA